MECDDLNGVTLPDKSALRVTRRGKAKLRVKVDSESFWILLRDVSYAPKLAINLISLGKLMLQGCCLATKNTRHAVMMKKDVVMYVQIKQNVLVVDRGTEKQRASSLCDVLMHAIQASGPLEITVQRASLMSFHRRFGHLNCDDVERLAANPAKGTELTDNVSENCLTCSEGKQSKTAQSKRDSGLNAIDVMGGFNCSDIKGPITPLDKRKIRYLINFIDHKSNYVRLFVAKSMDEAAKKFQHFMVFFEKRFNVRVHVLRTHGGGE